MGVENKLGVKRGYMGSNKISLFKSKPKNSEFEYFLKNCNAFIDFENSEFPILFFLKCSVFILIKKIKKKNFRYIPNFYSYLLQLYILTFVFYC